LKKNREADIGGPWIKASPDKKSNQEYICKIRQLECSRESVTPGKKCDILSEK
jgi:hypothetical protein